MEKKNIYFQKKYIYNMNNYIIILLSSIAGLSTVIGCIFMYIKVRSRDNLISLALGLSFIIMFLISCTELIPFSLKLVVGEYQKPILFIRSLFYLIIGYYIVKIINSNIKSENKLYKIGVLNTISLLIHNIPEGIITSISSIKSLKFGLKMCFLIMIHNIPEGIAISLPIYYATNNKKKALKYTIISGAGEIFGSLITIIFLEKYITNEILSIILMITSGIMITLSLTKILKEALNYQKYKYLLIGIIIGLLIITII